METATRYERIREKLASYGQEHLLAFYEELSAGEKETLLLDLEEIDFDLIARLSRGEGLFDPSDLPVEHFSPPQVWRLEEEEFTLPGGGKRVSRREAVLEGERLLREGKVVCLVVAGGQGSRLGFPGPKGTLPFGPVSGKTLFEIHGAKVKALEKRYETKIPLVVMTSEVNDEDTRRYFDLQDRFGLGEVRFMKQGVLPAVDDRGKLFLAARNRVFKSPDGHGGTIRALERSGLLKEFIERGFSHLFYFQVDNPLVKVAEPFFLGAHSLARSDYSLKILKKRSPEEKLGVLVISNGKYFIVEYSDLPPALAQARSEDGELRFWAGSPAIHVFALDFFDRLTREGVALPFHRARKKIPHIDSKGNPVKPEKENGIKFETFVFDSMPHARAVLALEGLREEEFAPVKNAAGEDSIESAQRMLSELHWKWLERRGVRVPRNPDGSPAYPCEIHPTFALGPEDIPEDVAGKIPAEGPVYLE